MDFPGESENYKTYKNQKYPVRLHVEFQVAAAEKQHQIKEIQTTRNNYSINKIIRYVQFIHLQTEIKKRVKGKITVIDLAEIN